MEDSYVRIIKKENGFYAVTHEGVERYTSKSKSYCEAYAAGMREMAKICLKEVQKIQESIR